MSGLYAGFTGLSGSTGLSHVAGLWSGGPGLEGGGGLPTDGSFTLLMDFAPDGGDVDWVNLDMDFITETYEVNEADPSVPAGTFINILVWR